jgi:hypothetical protein
MASWAAWAASVAFRFSDSGEVSGVEEIGLNNYKVLR